MILLHRARTRAHTTMCDDLKENKTNLILCEMGLETPKPNTISMQLCRTLKQLRTQIKRPSCQQIYQKSYEVFSFFRNLHFFVNQCKKRIIKRVIKQGAETNCFKSGPTIPQRKLIPRTEGRTDGRTDGWVQERSWSFIAVVAMPYRPLLV